MPRQSPSDLPETEAWRLLERLSSSEAPRLSPADQIALVQSLRERSAEMAARVDQSLIAQLHHLRQGLVEARLHLRDLEALLDKLRCTPWHPAIFLELLASDEGPAAVVACNGSVRVVGLADGVGMDALAAGDEVLLSQGMNLIMRRLDAPLLRAGETAEVQRTLADGRLIVRHRDEEIVVRAARSLAVHTLAQGERIRLDRVAGLAVERLGPTCESSLFLEETPADDFEHIGGLDAQIARLTRALRLHVLHPEMARRYHMRRATSVLLAGPPGTGKTMMARALANWLSRHSASGRARFMSVKPGQLHSMWYGQSESNYREAFRIARQACDADPSTPVVMFFDEVDAVGSTRGHTAMRIDDRVLTSFMTELDGLEARGNILLIAATNRRDMLDPALARPGRLGDVIIDIPRPGMAAGAAILDKHLPSAIPYAVNGHEDAAANRRRIIDAAVSRLYAPNGEGEVASLMFRDGTRRTLHARDLMSGAHIANVARAAIERACLRDVEGGEAGLTTADVLDAIADELSAAVAAVTPANCHAHLTDLPQDLGVVRVEPMRRQVRRPHRFLSAA